MRSVNLSDVAIDPFVNSSEHGTVLFHDPGTQSSLSTTIDALSLELLKVISNLVARHLPRTKKLGVDMSLLRCMIKCQNREFGQIYVHYCDHWINSLYCWHVKKHSAIEDELRIDIVIEGTGGLVDVPKAGKIRAGAKKVIITALANKVIDTSTYVVGTNEKEKDYSHEAYCTTNCLSHFMKIQHEEKVPSNGVWLCAHLHSSWSPNSGDPCSLHCSNFNMHN
ncbi:hypothetical protein RJT34_03882 [Clitoria ternatea]|uniref:Glyceraldehyde 3-phosphate dehydrogenase NAD(P) binding domain-containing protein n=1 Tax=Clitoria ternatea TaxID=43366 RepID=A0AAN9KNS4_CLITE